MRFYAVAAVAGALLASPATAAPTVPLPAIPLLSMTVADSSAAPHPGDRLTYTVTVVNRDRLPLSMTVRMVAPQTLDGLTALDGGRRRGRVMTWPVGIEPQQRVSVRFSAVPIIDARVAVTACVYLDGASRPTACASDVNVVTLPPPATAGQITRRYVAFFSGLLVLVLGWLWWRRRRGQAPVHVAEVIAAAKAGEPAIVAARPAKRQPERTQKLPFAGTPVAGSAARGPAADTARAAVEAGVSLTVTETPQAAAPGAVDSSDGVVSAASGIPNR